MSLPLTLPLHGSHLIEASAGTGKTWTIAALYLRLVLGHGREPDPADQADTGTQPPRALMPGEILVMTFTRAATRELSDRIRERLAEAARCFRGEPGSEPVLARDALLRELMAAYPAGEARERAAFRLALAAEAMDDAAVHTIDAWSQRMLREHAFDSGNLFDEELVADESALREQALRDVWRAEVYPLEAAALAPVLEVWPTLDHLRDDLPGLLPRLELFDAAPVADVAALLRTRVEAMQVLRQGWTARAAAMRPWLTALLNGPANPFNGNKMKADKVADWLDRLDAWAASHGPGHLRLADKDDQHDKACWRLTPAGLADALKKNQQAELPPVFAEFEVLQQRLAMLPDLASLLRQHAARRVAHRMDQLKQRAGRYGFADLQARLERALAGPRGPALRERIVGQYPVALIDEFQDTSPLQYRLFDRLYHIAADRPETGLFLIGDPKQSIYAFRGADIYSYLQARRDTEGRHHRLDTNFRATETLVGAVNHLFDQAERRLPGGAFALPKDGTLALPFDPVRARGRGERLVSSAGVVPALALCCDLTPLAAVPLRRRWAQHCAERIVTLLNDERCGLQGDDGRFTRLSPGDIAVLVRSRHEAAAVRQALAHRRVASVYLSDQESVFASGEAVELLRWLRAVADPADGRLARAAHAGAAIGLGLDELRRCSVDDEAWDVHLLRLRELHGVWQRQGVLAMLRRSLHELDLPARWLAQVDGERVLTNVLHLAELLQAASVQLEGEQALVRWMAEQIADHAAGVGEGGEDRIVRLESDAALVQIVTVHKSKGLEYPVVFLPHAASARPVDRRGRVAVESVDEAGRRALDFSLGDAALASAEQERLREDLRLFYVALTRARHALWLGVGLPSVRGAPDQTALSLSALGHLLGVAGRTVPVAELDAALRRLVDGQPGLCLGPPAAPTSQRLVARGQAPVLQAAPGYTTRIERDWTIGSFSALVRDLASAGPAVTWPATVADRGSASAPVAPGPSARVPTTGGGLEPLLPLGAVLNDPLREEAWREEQAAIERDEPADETPLPVPGQAQPWHRYPRGPLAGNFLHEQLERLADVAGWDAVGTPEFLRGLQRRCERQGAAYRAEDVQVWLQALVDTPLPPLGASLSQLRHHLVEMEFWMPSAGWPVAALDRLCREGLLPGLPRVAVPERPLRGLMMGFADLVFEHGGRYWVLDYKSNALGADDSAYGRPALEAAVLQHRYDLQAALYLLALHRLLRARLGEGYDPATHLGGAIYLFARGIDAPGRGCVHLPADPALLDGLDRLLDGHEHPEDL
ncbi:DNA helicase/exodeoxyribonuclease V beta subunit [Sphaerotilus hippei]|uniref:RecBCD enzyme subunit RecB n=1 Tax=Sphaerotilus hippei TaxID=744406 RepID=A0A318GYN4_9BURK|nr:exodeoxyribonuclease V subunit beta [Sphaerotilus hippei]PXW94971.1 DNA helicase/exodeoxyribonuclease V beta subunit [Sphaerotilus hippei]